MKTNKSRVETRKVVYHVNNDSAIVVNTKHIGGILHVYLKHGATNSNGVHPMFNKSSKSQTQSIKEYLLAGHTITPLEALELFGCFRLGARISDLKKAGLKISNSNPRDPRTGKRYACYRIVE